MGVSFCDGITCFLEVTPDDTIVLDGPPDGVLRNFPWFLVLEDHLHDSWIFRLRVPPRERILFGTISFRCYRESLTMRIAVKAKKTQVFPSMPSVLFPEEAVSLCNACGEVFLHPGEYAMSSGGRFSGMVHLFGEKGSTVISSTREVARIEDAQNASFSNLTFLHRGIHKGNVVVVLGGRVTFDHCTFSGGVQEKLNWMGNGLVVAYGAEVVLRHCVFLDNQGAGVIVEKGSCLIVENSLFFRNGKEGVCLRPGAFGVFHRSVFRENAWGVCLLPDSQGEFCANRIEANKLGGVLVSRGSQIAFRENTVRQHPVGVVFSPESAALWEENIFAENQQDILKE